MASVVRICAITAALLVGLSFVLFAVDQMSEGSRNQVESVRGSGIRAVSEAKINEPSPPPAIERAREAQHSSIREYIDDADDILVGPFTGLIESDQVWVQRLVPAALGLLLYGFGGLMLAKALPQPVTRTGGDWRQPAA
jgi:hypothetical protein